MPTRILTALPVFNEVRHVNRVLDEVQRYSRHNLVVDDGSTDGTSGLLAARGDVAVVTHEQNLGYGAALRTAFEYAAANEFDIVVTMDCDGQHQPKLIPRFASACQNVDVVSGSRYLKVLPGNTPVPPERRRINGIITEELNNRLGLHLTDAFCGFKAYRVAALAALNITETGYAMPLEFWAQAAFAGLRIVELPVPLIYTNEKRSFGEALDDAQTRLEYYRLVLERTITGLESRSTRNSVAAL